MAQVLRDMHDFTQFGFSEEANAAANEILDFTTCMRADGSVYGTAGQCRIGTETQKKPNLALKAYIRLMKKAKERGKPEDTSEYHAHHAFPKSIFKNKETADKRKVWLTHGEHFQAHHLLYRALKERYGEKDQRTIKMGYALGRMATGKGGEKLTPKQYDEIMKINTEVRRHKLKELWQDPERRKAREEINRKNWDKEGVREKYGRKMKEVWKDPDYRKKQAEKQDSYWKKEENKRQIEDRFKGRQWFNRVKEDGTIERKRFFEDPGGSWKKGRMNDNEGRKGLKFFHRVNETGEVERKQARESPGEGWKPGMGPKNKG